MKTYLLGVSAYSNADLLEKCVNSWSFISDEYKITKGIFFDGCSWKEEFKDLVENDFEKIRNNVDFILTLNDHVGVGGAWNEILRQGFIENNFDVVLICGSDVEFQKGYIESYIKEFEEQECDFSTARGFGFNCFAMTRKCYEIVGEFDLNLFPAYYEDNCMATRVRISKLKYGDVGDHTLLTHFGSAVIKKSEKFNKANGVTFPMNQRYYMKKWGIKDINKMEEYSYQTPFNDPNLTIKDWKLNIEEYTYKKNAWR